MTQCSTIYVQASGSGGNGDTGDSGGAIGKNGLFLAVIAAGGYYIYKEQ